MSWDIAYRPVVQGGGGGADAESDWIARSTLPLVDWATDFRNNTEFTNGLWPNGDQGLITRDTSYFLSGNAHLKMRQPVGGAHAPAWVHPLSNAFTHTSDGYGATEWWMQLRMKLSANRLTPSDGGGFKIFIIGGYDFDNFVNSNSHTGHEIVISTWDWSIPWLYRETGNGELDFTDAFGGGGDLKLHSNSDNGIGLPNNLRFCLYSTAGDTPPLPGCFFWPLDQVFTFLLRVKIQTYGGTTGNEIELKVHKAGMADYKNLYLNTGFQIGSDAKWPNGPNAIHLTLYDTGATSYSYEAVHQYLQVIVGRQFIPFPLDGL